MHEILLKVANAQKLRSVRTPLFSRSSPSGLEPTKTIDGALCIPLIPTLGLAYATPSSFFRCRVQ